MPKIVIIIFTAVVLLAGGSFFLLQQMEIGPFSSEETNSDEENELEKKAQKKERVFLSVAMEPLSIPIIQDGKVKLNLQIEIEFRTTEEQEPKLKQQLPILKDAYISDLFSFIPRQLRKSKKLDKETLERRLRIVGKRTIGKEKINAVVINSYSEATTNASQEARDTSESASPPVQN